MIKIKSDGSIKGTSVTLADGTLIPGVCSIDISISLSGIVATLKVVMPILEIEAENVFLTDESGKRYKLVEELST